MSEPLDLAPIEARLNAVQAETTQAQAARALRDFLNNAPTDIETLIAEVRRLTADRDQWRVTCERACADENDNARDLERVTRERDEARAALQSASVPNRVTDEIRALDPAAVVGSGSSIHAALPSPDTYQWSATGPNGCLLLSPADCIVARIDRDGTGWRPQIPGRGPLKWAADFPSAVRQVRGVLGDVVPDGSAAVVGSGS